MEISPAILISDALTMLSPDDPSVYFEEQQTVHIVHGRDMENMVRMGLGSLPIEAIGIPTLTPLAESNTPDLYDKLDISKRLTKYFPGNFVAALYELQSIFNKAEIKGYVIGGIVRDLMLFEERRLELNDVDITVVTDALTCTEHILSHSKNFSLVETFPAFGTAIIHYKDSLHIDVASTRKEHYPGCGILPVVFERGVPLHEDVIRRDFTINALALSIHDLGKVIDYAGGLQDIESHTIRILHGASFFEDPSRIFRALKFATRLDFHLSPGTQRLMERFLHYAPMIYKGGGERVKQELKGFLSEDEGPAKSTWLHYANTHQAIHLADMGIAQELQPLPGGATLWQEYSQTLQTFEQTLSEAGVQETLTPDSRWLVYLCLFFESLSEDALAHASLRLGLTKKERDVLDAFKKCRNKPNSAQLSPDTSPVDLFKHFHGVPLAACAATLLSLSQDAPETLSPLLNALIAYKTKLENIKVILDGNDLLELGVPQGIQVGTTLKQLLYAKLEGGLESRLDEVHYVQTLLEEEAPHVPPTD
jgi:tRNA nucleotidyltransferase (CCA-adding enzyme)